MHILHKLVILQACVLLLIHFTHEVSVEINVIPKEIGDRVQKLGERIENDLTIFGQKLRQYSEYYEQAVSSLDSTKETIE
uniref:Uncharacterized protein n=1 Tax=Trichobilharzia regenti TaxID=157069 RepID=A0AA85JIW5_TRIRE|nr:unnamed protein product [Trichobilharzia regenti]